MIKIHRFVFNPFQQNTFLLYDQTSTAVIIDAGCSNEYEENEISDFIAQNNLRPVHHLLTHTHIDHIFGVGFMFRKYGLRPVMHKLALPFLHNAKMQAKMFGVDDIEIVEPEMFIDESSEIEFGKSVLRVIYTPGHVDGHVCFISGDDKFAVVGDVIFLESIGRTDLPTGDFNILKNNIREKIYTLDEEYVLYPGHGPATTVGHEKHNNPYVIA